MAEEGKEDKGFKVQDRRRFSPETGEPREDGEKIEPSPETSDKRTEERSSEEKKATGESLPEINFSTFLISLSTQALMHLGEIPNPLSGKVESDAGVAKQMIDIIAVLAEKTRGNLDQGEAKLMESVLFDLRMKYVEAVKQK
ncbi:MAG: DUF1844 domain-containing protein [Candidatus Binatia bacterium]